MQNKVQMDNNGKILIPTALRKELGFNSGDTFVLKKVNNQLHISSLNHAISEAHALMQKYISEDKSLEENFMQDQEKEAESNKQEEQDNSNDN